MPKKLTKEEKASIKAGVRRAKEVSGKPMVTVGVES